MLSIDYLVMSSEEMMNFHYAEDLLFCNMMIDLKVWHLAGTIAMVVLSRNRYVIEEDCSVRPSRILHCGG